jgi:hypothetical protein
MTNTSDCTAMAMCYLQSECEYFPMWLQSDHKAIRMRSGITLARDCEEIAKRLRRDYKTVKKLLQSENEAIAKRWQND